MWHQAASNFPAGVRRKYRAIAVSLRESQCAWQVLGHPCRDVKQVRVRHCKEDLSPKSAAQFEGGERMVHKTPC